MRLAPIKRTTSRTGLRAAAAPLADVVDNGHWAPFWNFPVDTADAGGSASALSAAGPWNADVGLWALSPKFGPFWLFGSARMQQLVSAYGIAEIRADAEQNLSVEQDYWTERALWEGTSSPVMFTAAIASGSANVTVASTTGITASMAVVGTGIPSGTTVSSVTNGTVFVMSANASATNATASLSIIEALTVADDNLVTAMPSLTSTAVVSSGGATARALTVVLDELILAMRGLGHKGPVTFHTPDHAQAAWFDTGIMEQVGDQWLMAGEHPAVFGAGYTDNGPAGAVAAAGTAWVIASGPIELTVDSVVRSWAGPSTEAEIPFETARRNTTLVRAQKLAGYRFNTPTVLAARTLVKGDVEAT